MSAKVLDELSREVGVHCCRVLRIAAARRWLSAWLVVLLLLLAPLLRGQAFEPTVTVGAGVQGSYQGIEPTGGSALNQFSLDHARIYLSGTVTPQISVMFNTDYNTVTNNAGILDAAGQFDISPKFNVWVGRFLPPSDRANLYGPFYANEWAVYTDGVQDGYPFVFQGRDNGIMYWGDFKSGVTKIKVAVGGFDGGTATGNTDVIWAARVQLDFWDPEDGYYLNGTYYSDKNLLAIAGATEVQASKTATTVDFLMERKVMGGGAFTIEAEYSRYNRLGGYNANYAKSEGGYGLASFLIPKQVAIGKFEVLGKFAQADFTNGVVAPLVKNPNYHQRTTEINFDYIIKQFDARIMSFYKDTRFNAVNANFWEAGVGVQFQISKTIHP